MIMLCLALYRYKYCKEFKKKSDSNETVCGVELLTVTFSMSSCFYCHGGTSFCTFFQSTERAFVQNTKSDED